MGREALKRIEITNALYGDALVSGSRVALIPGSHLETHLGNITLPVGERFGVIYPRVSDVIGFQFAGVAHDTDTLAWWHEDRWTFGKPIAGVSPVIFDQHGTLHLNDGSAGSQGYRYVDEAGRLVTADATYYDAAHDLSEYTIAGDIRIGQSHDNNHDDAIVFIDGARRLIEPGPCRFIRVDRVGDQFAITLCKFGQAKVVHLWMTRAELVALPVVSTTSTQPPPNPQPVPVPVPTPTPKPTPQPVPDSGIPNVPTPGPVIPKVGSPQRTPWLAGVCWPLGAAEVIGSLDHTHLRELALLGVNAIRIDTFPGNVDAIDLLQSIIDAGLRPWPILRMGADLGSTTAFAGQIVRAFPGLVDYEIENEVSAKMSPAEYGALVNAVGRVIRNENPNAGIYVSCECYDFNTGKPHAFWSQVKPLLSSELYDGCAIHPYRNPKPWDYSAFGSRTAEWGRIRDVIGDKRLAVTEFGWEGGDGSKVINELDEDRAGGCTASFIYAHVSRPSGFGLFEDRGDGAWHLTPTAIQVQQYLTARPL